MPQKEVPPMTLTTPTSAYGWRPDQVVFTPDDAVPDALILQCSTPSGVIEGDEPSLHVPYVDDATADFFAEAQEITESVATLDQAVVYTGKIAQLVTLSNEQYRQANTANRLADSVSRAIITKADQAFIAQVAPTPPEVAPPAGLLNVTDITEGDAVTDNLDELVDLVAELESIGSNPSHIIVDPLGYATVAKFKAATDSNQSLIGAGVSPGALTLLGLPVVKNRNVTPYSGLVVDRSAVISAVGPIRVDTSSDSAFAHDAVQLRATWRIGWTVKRPERIGAFTIAGDGS